MKWHSIDFVDIYDLLKAQSVRVWRVRALSMAY